MKFKRIFVTLNKQVKRKMISEDVSNSRPRRKLIVKQIKCWKDFIKPIIHIDNSSLDFCPLERSEGIQR